MDASNIRENVTIRDVYEARQRISSMVNKTPLVHSIGLSENIGRNVYLKLENVHDIGAFKVRGAANKILSLSNSQKKKGISTFSTGNHGLAVTYVAKKLGINVVVCVSNNVPKVKLEFLRKLGAQIEMHGESQDEASERCLQLEKQLGLTAIPPFDGPHIIAGHGTIGLGLIEEIPDLIDVLIPLSGGGLLSGIGLTLKSIDTDVNVIGTTINHSAVMYESLKQGHPVKLPEGQTLADSLLGGIGLNNQYTFRLVKSNIDNIFTISENEIADSMVYMLKEHRMLIEGAAATSIAPVLNNRIPYRKGSVVAIIRGNNVDLSVIQQLLKINT
ncbi:pyridoxal-phosphate dependent enzyme [Mesobacillus maritimus]|uniref:pyridoxal-phosphate dependent enzyme n=1 Tax=Mesobacillus maritimus TaxID=1643336 RepID=UPI002040DBD8|nr:pyridoxal-phosphate dependent enzyme [Mesobacillus maritimus]MCM3584397.1 pyridoxal-phosphate dependent enzyme [Mesobacillus maritimus]MCM3669186.1 pyridoxal-phosphate dependent enzyme [Mesobacillus maritimus]